MQIKWFPRSWIQIKTEGSVIYIDPSYLSTYFSKSSKKVVFTEAEDDCLPEKLEKADLILISHIHKDHCKEITIQRLSAEDTTILTPKKYKNETDDRVKLIKPGDIHRYHGISIQAVYAYNTLEGKSSKKVHKKGECVGYLLNIEGRCVYFSGDTDLIPEMKDLGRIDLAIIPIGGVFTMDIGEALQCVETINPKYVIPVHHLKMNPQDFETALTNKSNSTVALKKAGDSFEL